jgi:UDPglucose 6-dehydrogenase
LLEEVMRINDEQRQRFLRKVRSALWTLKGKRLAVLGLAFKGGTDDVRESPAVAIVETLMAEGCEVRAYDPAAAERARELLSDRGISYVDSAYEAADGADALLVLTEWQDFKDLDFSRIHKLLRYPIVIDGRNLFSTETMREHGFIYLSMGRPDVVPSEERLRMRSIVASKAGQ